MKVVVNMIVTAAIIGLVSCEKQQTQLPCLVAESDMAGDWNVALYFNPPNPPSETKMSVSFDDDKKMSGSFYGSTFELASGVLFENEYAFTAVTSDGTGPYLHSGRLKCDGKVYGQTLSQGREFIMPWIATREGDT